MKKLWILLILAAALCYPVSALDYTAPEAPEAALELLPESVSDFGSDLITVIFRGIKAVQPSLAEAVGVCVSVFAVVMLTSLLKALPGKAAMLVDFAGVLAIMSLVLIRTKSFVSLASNTVEELSEYGKLLLPVMTMALASQGGVTTSAILYTATMALDALLGTVISKLLVPMVYVYLALALGAATSGEDVLGKLRDFSKWLISWCLKTIVYLFTAFMTLTGVISGTTDAAAVKAAKLTFSGVVPVVGGMLSDASEAVLISAGVVKNAVGVYGLLAVIAIWIMPFLKIAIQYLLLKLTAALCQVFGGKQVNSLVQSFSTAMGLLLGMTGSVCILLLISTVCFMKGVT